MSLMWMRPWRALRPISIRTASKLPETWLPTGKYATWTNSRPAPWSNFQGHRRYSFGGWLMGAMAVGMTRWGLISDNPRYLDFIREQGRDFAWQVEARVFDADDYVIGQTYLELFELDRDPEMLETTRRAAQPYIRQLADGEPRFREGMRADGDLAAGSAGPGSTRCSWARLCGSTWPRPPGTNASWSSETGNSGPPSTRSGMPAKASCTAIAATWPCRDSSGNKVFWSRGNGWAFAAFARIIPRLPEEHVSRGKYVDRFRAMAARLTELQHSGGYWTSSLTNEAISPTPETSGTAFFTYGLAWGINQGLLDRETCLPAVERAWSSLVSNLYADGRLAYVQPSGSAPQTVHKESTDVYGVGAFLLAASEVYRLANSPAATH